MKKVNYILFLLIIGNVMISNCQVVPWTVTPTSNFQEIVLKKADSTANYDFTFDTNGDAIGVFFDQSGVWVCGGYIVLDGVTKSFLIYGNDAVDNGFQPFENYHLKYWRKKQNCIIDQPFAGMSNAQYSTGGSDTIIVLGAWPAIVNFPKNYYCKYDVASQNLPLQISGTTFANLSISIQPPSLTSYNASIGVIENFYDVDPNVTYQFSVSTLDNKCLRYQTFPITISNKLFLSQYIKASDPTCANKLVQIKTDTSTFVNGTKPYSISLIDNNSGITFNESSGIFNDVGISTYKLVVKDFFGCSDTSEVTINPITIDCDNIPDILTPGQNNNFSQVYFPWEGEIIILNSRGETVRKIIGPSIWDGTDVNGVIFKSGLYIIFNNNKKKKEITLVY